MVHILLLGSSRQAYTKMKEAVNNCEFTIINTTNMLKPFYSKLYSRVLTTLTRDDDEWIKLAKVVNEIQTVDRVITLDDNLQELAYVISKELNISPLYSLDTIHLLNNKFAMRNFLRKKNFAKESAVVLENKKNLQKAVFDQGEVIIKPVSGSGSKNIFKLSRFDNIDVFFEKNKELFLGSKFLVEPFFHGEEYSVESYSEDGKHKIYGITKKIKDDYFVETGHVVPGVTKNQELINRIKYIVKKFLDLVGVTDGPTHTEVIVSPNGINIVESQPRIGGDMINNLYEFATGVDIFSLIMKGLCGEKVFLEIPDYDLDKFKRFAFVAFLSSKSGKVVSIKNSINLNADNHIKGVNINCEIGDNLVENRSSLGRVAYYWGVANSYSEAINECLTIQSRIQIETKS